MLQYRLCLIKLRKLGFIKVFSYTLGEEAGVSAEQVRKDFSQYGIRGNKKAGYDINDLMVSINEIFQRKEPQNVILFGIGNIGKALINYENFRKNNIQIIAGFDIDPSKINKKLIVPIYHPDQLDQVIHEFQVKVAILAVPELSAQEVCNTLVDRGIIGILNFSPSVLKVPEHVIVNNVNLGNELEGLIYITNFMSGV